MDTTALEWMHKSGVANLVISIGRVCDTNRQTKSLVKLLQNLKKDENRDYLSREGYLRKNIVLGLEFQDRRNILTISSITILFTVPIKVKIYFNIANGIILFFGAFLFWGILYFFLLWIYRLWHTNEHFDLWVEALRSWWVR